MCIPSLVRSLIMSTRSQLMINYPKKMAWSVSRINLLEILRPFYSLEQVKLDIVNIVQNDYCKRIDNMQRRHNLGNMTPLYVSDSPNWKYSEVKHFVFGRQFDIDDGEFSKLLLVVTCSI